MAKEEAYLQFARQQLQENALIIRVLLTDA
jgi:hypothetical protein